MVLAEAPTKRCPLCGEELPRAAFYRNRSQRDGLASRCKGCEHQVSPNAYGPNDDGGLTPWQRLGKAMLQRMVRDAIGQDVPIDRGTIAERERLRAQAQRNAWNWLQSYDFLFWVDATFTDEQLIQETVALVNEMLREHAHAA